MRKALALAVLLPLLLAAGEPAGGGDPATETVHVVKPGETLIGVARRAGVERSLIVEANGLEPPYLIRIGQKLVIPRKRVHEVAKGDTGFAIAYRYGVSWSAIATANNIDPGAPIRPGQKLLIPTLSQLPEAKAGPAPGPAPSPAPGPARAPKLKPPPMPSPEEAAQIAAPRFKWPAPGDVLRGFAPPGRRGAHPGLDIGGKEGSAVRAVAEGEVIFAGEEPSKFGNLVVIDHGNGWHSAYGKLQKVTVKVGERARQRERVGLLGHTGETSSTELHFEIRHYNLPVDPEKLLPERK